jgi:hypothetical protein
MVVWARLLLLAAHQFSMLAAVDAAEAHKVQVLVLAVMAAAVTVE